MARGSGRRASEATTDHDPTETVRALYAAFDRRDRAAALALLAEDVVWHFAGRWLGREGVSDFLFALVSGADRLEFRVNALVAEEERVVALGEERFRVKATGREWGTQWAQVYRLAGGLIAQYDEFADTAAIARAYAG